MGVGTIFKSSLKATGNATGKAISKNKKTIAAVTVGGAVVGTNLAFQSKNASTLESIDNKLGDNTVEGSNSEEDAPLIDPDLKLYIILGGAAILLIFLFYKLTRKP